MYLYSRKIRQIIRRSFSTFFIGFPESIAIKFFQFFGEFGSEIWAAICASDSWWCKPGSTLLKTISLMVHQSFFRMRIIKECCFILSKMLFLRLEIKGTFFEIVFSPFIFPVLILFRIKKFVIPNRLR